MENPTTENQPQPQPASNVSPPSNERVSVSLNLSHAINLCAAGLLICFFLPWINFFGLTPSGFDFAKHEKGKALLLWAIPIFSALTIFANITKRSPKIVAQLTGALPFAVLAYGLYQEGKDVMRVLSTGAYIGLALGLVLFTLPRRLK